MVGIKVNAGGRPWVVSSHEIVAETIRNLMAVGVKPQQIYIYERFQNQLDQVNYTPQLPEGVNIFAAERGNARNDNQSYDPRVYVEADFFGEDDTRSNMIQLVSQKLTKIINIPNMKDHGATGATGCLKNIAYGSFSNVARTHHKGVSHTLSFVGTLAAVEPLRSKTVLQIMDGLRGVWHGGPFAPTLKYVFFPRTIMFGTDPVAIDRLLLDIIDDERKRAGSDFDLESRREHARFQQRRATVTRTRTPTSSSANRDTSNTQGIWGWASTTRTDPGEGDRRYEALAGGNKKGKKGKNNKKNVIAQHAELSEKPLRNFAPLRLCEKPGCVGRVSRKGAKAQRLFSWVSCYTKTSFLPFLLFLLFSLPLIPQKIRMARRA